jgi:hypothetical protein
VGNLDLDVKEAPFVQFPYEWVIDLKGEELKRMVLLSWRFDFFAKIASDEGRDIRRCFYESQEKLAVMFGLSPNSRPKISQFMTKMEKAGYISTQRENMNTDGEIRTRIYIVVNNPLILGKYGMTI